ncbi:MAG: hypothetical protein JJU28_18335 [Cyclobacteriaceae bacterium]|nr:hypothetical protein [Cyclobacteriaceae bacterium]
MIRRSNLISLLFKKIIPIGLVLCVSLLVVQDIFKVVEEPLNIHSLNIEEHDLEVDDFQTTLLRFQPRQQQVLNGNEVHFQYLLSNYIPFFRLILNKPVYSNAYKHLYARISVLRSHIRINAP